jgi:hypothetical protein
LNNKKFINFSKPSRRNTEYRHIANASTLAVILIRPCSLLKKVIFRTLKLLLFFYVLICVGLYFFQEKLLFFPDKLTKDYKFSFTQTFDEINIATKDGKSLNGLLFKADSVKGLVFYLHGNAGSLDNWGDVAKRYTELHYNVFILDYPGYGKSEGSIHSKSSCLTPLRPLTTR